MADPARLVSKTQTVTSFHASPVVRNSHFKQKSLKVSSQDPFWEKLGNFSLYSLTLFPNASSQAHQIWKFQITRPLFQKQKTVRKPSPTLQKSGPHNPTWKQVECPPRDLRQSTRNPAKVGLPNDLIPSTTSSCPKSERCMIITNSAIKWAWNKLYDLTSFFLTWGGGGWIGQVGPGTSDWGSECPSPPPYRH